MQIYIHRSDQQHGPYTLAEANGYLSSGSLVPSDLAWYEGLADWIPLSSIPGINHKSNSSTGKYTDAEICEIGSKQKAILWALLASFAAFAIPFGPIAAGLISAIFIYQLATALKSPVAWLYVILAFIPLVGIIALLVINSKATEALRARGLKVGFMGVSSSTLSAFESNSRMPATPFK